MTALLDAECTKAWNLSSFEDPAKDPDLYKDVALMDDLIFCYWYLYFHLCENGYASFFEWQNYRPNKDPLPQFSDEFISLVPSYLLSNYIFAKGIWPDIEFQDGPKYNRLVYSSIQKPPSTNFCMNLHAKDFVFNWLLNIVTRVYFSPAPLVIRTFFYFLFVMSINPLWKGIPFNHLFPLTFGFWSVAVLGILDMPLVLAAAHWNKWRSFQSGCMQFVTNTMYFCTDQPGVSGFPVYVCTKSVSGQRHIYLSLTSENHCVHAGVHFNGTGECYALLTKKLFTDYRTGHIFGYDLLLWLFAVNVRYEQGTVLNEYNSFASARSQMCLLRQHYSYDSHLLRAISIASEMYDVEVSVSNRFVSFDTQIGSTKKKSLIKCVDHYMRLKTGYGIKNKKDKFSFRSHVEEFLKLAESVSLLTQVDLPSMELIPKKLPFEQFFVENQEELLKDKVYRMGVAEKQNQEDSLRNSHKQLKEAQNTLLRLHEDYEGKLMLLEDVNVSVAIEVPPPAVSADIETLSSVKVSPSNIYATSDAQFLAERKKALKKKKKKEKYYYITKFRMKEEPLESAREALARVRLESEKQNLERRKEVALVEKARLSSDIKSFNRIAQHHLDTINSLVKQIPESEEKIQQAKQELYQRYLCTVRDCDYRFDWEKINTVRLNPHANFIKAWAKRQKRTKGRVSKRAAKALTAQTQKAASILMSELAQTSVSTDDPRIKKINEKYTLMRIMYLVHQLKFRGQYNNKNPISTKLLQATSGLIHKKTSEFRLSYPHHETHMVRAIFARLFC
jgi:hypothetical protein